MIKTSDNYEKNNPIYIPRNHLVESALNNAINGNKEEFDKILHQMSNTYEYDVKQTTPDGFDETYKHFVEPNDLDLVSFFNLVKYQLVKNIYEK